MSNNCCQCGIEDEKGPHYCTECGEAMEATTDAYCDMTTKARAFMAERDKYRKALEEIVATYPTNYEELTAPQMDRIARKALGLPFDEDEE